MRYFYLFLLVVLFQPCFAQVQRAFITKNGTYSNDPKNAVAYVLIQKLDGDSAYAAKEYDMNDSIIMKGTYKDELLRIPSGKFEYFNKNYPTKDKKAIGGDNFNSDTNTYVQSVGYFVNGKRTGVWIGYGARGVKSSVCNYEDGKLNGPCTIYDKFSGFWAKYNMVNDTLVGKLDVFTADSLLYAEQEFHNNKPLRTIFHLIYAKPNADFDSYLEENLEKYHKELSENQPDVEFTVDTTGKIVNPKIVKGINPEIDTAIIKALSEAPDFTPATFNGVPISQKLNKILLLYIHYPNYVKQLIINIYSATIITALVSNKDPLIETEIGSK